MRSPGRVTEIVESASGDKPSEDFAGYRHVGSELHLWVIDGATSVTETPPVMRDDMTDPAWFARRLSAEVCRAVGHGRLSRTRLARTLSPICEEFSRRAPKDLDLAAWPLAAMTYLCVSPHRGGLRFEGLSYADCFFDLRPAPSRAPLPPSTAMPPLPEGAGLLVDAAGRARMQERRRTVLRGEDNDPVTIFPESALAGRSFRFTRRGSQVLHLGSDGFARFWEEYALETQASEMLRVLRLGALREVCRLRDWEIAHADHGRAPKPVDDVTLIRVELEPRGLPTAALSLRRRHRTRQRIIRAR